MHDRAAANRYLYTGLSATGSSIVDHWRQSVVQALSSELTPAQIGHTDSSHRTTHHDVCDLANNIARNEIHANTINNRIQAKHLYPRITLSAMMYHEDLKKKCQKFGTAVTTPQK